MIYENSSTQPQPAVVSKPDYDLGWKLWSDMVRYYPSGVHRRRLITKWLAPLAPLTVLDAGCGPGHLLQTLRRSIPNAAFTGVDDSQETVLDNRRRLPWCQFERRDLGKEKLSQRFDVVVCSEVLEHIPEDEAALEHLCAMTGRYLMITVPTGPIFPLEAGFGHLRHYDVRSLCSRLEAHGMRVIKVSAWGFPWMTLFKRASNFRPRKVLDNFGAGKWSWPQKTIGLFLTWLFYLNLPFGGPQILVLAEQNRKHSS